MDLKRKTDFLLNKYNLRAKKKFGQNFLVDENIINRIVEESNISKDDVVIEIGPGLGNLTEKLLNAARNVIAFEIDEDMIDVLQDRFKDEHHFTLVNQDILKADLAGILKENGLENKSVKLVANLPYYITTPIMFKIFEDANFIQTMTIMVQKEVADRIVARPGSKDYGVLTVNTKYYGEATKLFDVPSSSFVPAPNVTSSIVKICLSAKYDVKDKEFFFKLIKASFAQRRKKLINSIENSRITETTKEEIKGILEKCCLSENARAEEIDIETYIKMSELMLKKSED